MSTMPNISLAQFNKIASGTYNAGLVDFKTDSEGNVKDELIKVNNHVHATSKNDVVLSPDRIVAVKESFIAALRKGGVSEESINEVRAKLGIPAETKLTANKEEMHKMLMARFRPLSRQYVRVLLDKFAERGAGMTDESRSAVSAKDLANARKTAAIKAFTGSFAMAQATTLQTMALNADEASRMYRKFTEQPKTFATAITDILFDNFNALRGGA